MPVVDLKRVVDVAGAPCRRVGNDTSALAYLSIVCEADGRVTFAAIAYDVMVRAVVAGDVVQRGAAFVLASQLRGVLATLPPSGVVQLCAEPGPRLAVECGRARMTLKCLDATDAPSALFEDPASQSVLVAVPSAILTRLLAVALPFVAQNDKRPALCAVHVEIDDAGVRSVSTDGAGMATAAVEWGGPRLVLDLPTEVASMVGPAVERTGCDDVEILRSGDGTLDLRAGDTLIRARPTGERFPDWRRVVPDTADECVVVDRREVAATLNRLRGVGDGKRVRLSVDGDALVIEADDGTGNYGREALAASHVHAFPVVFVDAARLGRILACFTADAVRIQAVDAMSPILITSPDDPAPSLVLMPMSGR